MSCPICSVEVPPNHMGRPRLYCSDLCASRAWTAMRATSGHPLTGTDKPCPICGTAIPFDPRRRNQKYCSIKCSHDAMTRRAGADTPVDLAIKAGKTCREISDELGIPAENIRSRARQRGLQIKRSVIPFAERKPVEKTRGVAKLGVRIPGEQDPRKLAKELHKQGKSVLVISGLTGLSRAVLAPLLGTEAPPQEYRGYTPRKRNMWRDTVTPAMFGSKLVFEGPIKKRAYRVIHNAKLSPLPTGGEKMESGKIALKTSDFSEAIHNCAGKKSVVVDSSGTVLAKGAVYQYSQNRTREDPAACSARSYRFNGPKKE